MTQVVEFLAREGSNTADVVTSDGDVKPIDDFLDADGDIIDVSTRDEEPVLPELSAKDRRIAELEAARDEYEEWLAKEADKLGWSTDSVRAKHGIFPGEQELVGLIVERDRKNAQVSAAGIVALLRQQRQARINRITDPSERAAAQRELNASTRRADANKQQSA